MRFSSSLRESLRLEFDGEDAAGAAGQPWRDHCYIRQGGAVLPSCPRRTARRVCVRESATEKTADESFSFLLCKKILSDSTAILVYPPFF